MTVTIHLTPDMEAGLLAQAQESGMVLEDYLLTLVEKAALPSINAKATAERAEAVHRMLEFGEKHHLSLGKLCAGGRFRR
jgi:hypothetical protein